MSVVYCTHTHRFRRCFHTKKLVLCFYLQRFWEKFSGKFGRHKTRKKKKCNAKLLLTNFPFYFPFPFSFYFSQSFLWLLFLGIKITRRCLSQCVLRRAHGLYFSLESYYGTSIMAILWPICGDDSHILGWCVLWMLVNRRPDVFIKCHRRIFCYSCLTNVYRVALSQQLTDFHTYPICTWAKMTSGLLLPCTPLLKLIIPHLKRRQFHRGIL